MFAVDTGTGNSFATRATFSSTSGQGTVTATLTDVCGSIDINYDVWVGKPDWEDIYVYEESGQPVCPNSTARIYASLPSNQGSVSGYEWGFLVSNGVTIQSGKYSNPVTVETPGPGFGYFIMKVKVENSCGWSGFKEDANPMYEDYGCGGMFSINVYPNPATNEFTISFKDIKIDEHAIADTYKNIKSTQNIDKSEISIKLFNKEQELVLDLKSDNKSMIVDANHLPKGLYYLHVQYLDDLEKRQIVIR